MPAQERQQFPGKEGNALRSPLADVAVFPDRDHIGRENKTTERQCYFRDCPLAVWLVPPGEGKGNVKERNQLYQTLHLHV